MSQRDPSASQIAANIDAQKKEHANREYALRRGRAHDIERQNHQQERQRVERIVYLAGAVPLTSLSLMNLHQYPAIVMVFALILAVFAYGFWYINEFYGNAWRLEHAHADADLWFEFASPNEQMKNSREKRISGDAASHEAQRTIWFVAGYLWASFAFSAFAHLDQFIDSSTIETPPIMITLVGISVVVFASAILWLCEFIKILKIGWSF